MRRSLPGPHAPHAAGLRALGSGSPGPGLALARSAAPAAERAERARLSRISKDFLRISIGFTRIPIGFLQDFLLFY